MTVSHTICMRLVCISATMSLSYPVAEVFCDNWVMTLRNCYQTSEYPSGKSLMLKASTSDWDEFCPRMLYIDYEGTQPNLVRCEHLLLFFFWISSPSTQKLNELSHREASPVKLEHQTELALNLCFSPSLIPEYWEPRCAMHAPLVGSQMECCGFYQ